MKKLVYILSAFLLFGSALFTPVQSQVITEEPDVVDTWDSEVGWCHGSPVDCYEMIDGPTAPAPPELQE
jgi:hypothetical protein